MRKVRIGNDINVRWEVKTDGQAVSLEGKALKLYVRSAYRKEEITTFTVEGCVVSFVYPASMQRMTGARAVILEDATEGAPRRTVCADQAFTLVAHTCEENDDDVEFENFMVSLQSNVLIGKPGLSAYEVWLNEGNTGTLEDWYAYLQKPATDVAAKVTKAETARVEAEKKREDAENARAEAETARQDAENGRDTAEQKRAGNEDTRKTAEQSRNTAELDRRTDENIRTENESTRMTEENKRIAAERRRAATFSALSAGVDAVVGKANAAIEETDAAEALRAAAETGRTRAEDERETNEQKRKLGETERKSAEMQREEVEESRVAAENSRVTAEKQRYDAERERRQHEDAREDSEGKRDTAERLRKQAETGRDNAEQERTASEQTRMENETQRETNERKREEAEDKREEAIVKFEKDFNEKLSLKADLEEFNNTVSDIDTKYEQKVNDLELTMLYGGEKTVVESSIFLPNSSLTLASPIILSEIGDYVEIKAKVEGKGTLLISNTYSSNKPVIRYQYFGSSTDKVQLYVWMDGETATRSSKCISGALNVNEEHTVKVLLSSKSGNICTYEVYIDDAKIIATKETINPIPDGTQTTFHGVGLTDGTYSFDKKCVITYIKYVSNGASEVLLRGLSTKGTINGTVTENINNVKYKSTKEIEEKILSVDKNVGKIEEDLHSTNERIDKVIEDKYEIQELTSEDSRVTLTENYVIPGDGKPISSNGYYVFTFIADIDYDVWFTYGQKTKYPSFLAISTETSDGSYTPRRRYIKNSEDTLPTESSSLSLKKGDKLYLSTKINEFTSAKVVSWMVSYKNGKELNSNLPLSKEHIEQVVNTSSNPMFVKKDFTSLTVFFANKKGSYIAYPLVKRYEDFQEGVYPSFLDNWGIENVSEYTIDNGIMSKKAQLFQNGEAELAINLPRFDTEANTYVGGHAHGFENIVNADNGREFAIFVDNVKVNEDDDFSLKSCSKIEVYQHSTLCQAYSNSNPFADVTKKWVFYEGEVSITTTVKMLRDMSIRQAQFGMMCVYRRLNGNSEESYLTNKAVKDTMPYKTFAVEDNWNVPELRSKDHDACRVIEFGDYGLGFIMEIEDDNRKTNGGMFVHNNGTGAYNKIYFDLTGAYQAKKDELLYATQIWSIR